MASMKLPTIESALSGRKNNFDVLRLIAAIAVIFSHSYDTGGSKLDEPLVRFSHAQMSIGEFSVVLFFVISGFLITQSFDRSQDVLKFIKARALRIFPAIIVLVLLTVFVLGPAMTTLSVSDYFSDPKTWRYLTTITLLPIWTDSTLPQVFHHNLLPDSVNGSLWTLEFELICYGIVAALGVAKLLRGVWVIALLIISIVLTYVPIHSQFFSHIPYFFNYFAVGMLCYLYRARIKLSGIAAFVSLVAIVVSCYVGAMVEVLIFAGSYLFIYLCLSPSIKLPKTSKYGDFSYGLYIFAFPIQQMISSWLFPNVSPMKLFAIALPVTLAISIASWHLIEKRALSYRTRPAASGATVRRAW
jgi:peptidoglycan/LPS O-acetylase OafA/YrhL